MDVPELVPLDEYDATQAKLEASISWLLSKAYGHNIPEELQEPFCYNQQDKFCCKPVLITSLTGADVYCRACANIVDDRQHSSGHSGVIETLSKRGVYVIDLNESAVTENVLAQTQPFRITAHLALIDSLMTAYTSQIVTIERVVHAVRRFASFNASSELPYDTEDAILFWINKVCGVVRHRLDRLYKTKQDKENAQGRHSRSRAAPFIPFMHDLLKDIYDGCCLATTISFYCPTTLRQHDIAMEESIRTADAMFNIQLVLEFCTENIAHKVAHLSLNDLFYTNHILKPNLLAFLAELFYCFEIKRLPCVQEVGQASLTSLSTQSNVSDAGPDDGDLEVAAKRNKFSAPSVQISDVTKKSFNQSETPTPSLHASQQVPPARQPLLPKRLQQRSESPSQPPFRLRWLPARRCQSFTAVDRPPLRQSAHAWHDDSTAVQPGRQPEYQPGHPDHQPGQPDLHSAAPGYGGAWAPSGGRHSNFDESSGSNMLSAVSIDSDASIDFSTDTSVTLTELSETSRSSGTPKPTIVDRNQPSPAAMSKPAAKGTNLKPSNSLREAYKSREEIVFPFKKPSEEHGQDQQEALVPAHTRPAKEKSNHHSKGVESGEYVTRQQQAPKTKSNPQPAPSYQRSAPSNQCGSDSDEPSDSEYQTPSSESAPYFSVIDDSARKNASPKHSARSAKTSAQPAARGQTDGAPRGDAGSACMTLSGQPIDAEIAKIESHRSTVIYDSRDGPHGQGDAMMSRHGDVAASGERSATAQSFVLNDAHDEESARAAGIPVVNSNEFRSTSSTPQRRQWHKPQVPFEGSPRNSSDGSDQELRKIHADNRESETKSESFYITSNGETVNRPDSLKLSKPITSKLSSKNSAPKTSFAQIQRVKSVEGNVGVYQSNEPSEPPVNISLKEQFDRHKSAGQKPGKKTTFAALPNQTTWSDYAQKSAQERTPGSGSEEGNGDAQTPQAEILNIRMMLGESRRKIESDKRKSELEMKKQRQRVGKQAFMQVISKNKDEPDPHSKHVLRNAIPEEESSPPNADPGLSLSQTHARNNSADRAKSSPQIRSNVPDRTSSAERSRNTVEHRTSSVERSKGGPEHVTKSSPERSRSSVQRSKSSVERTTPRMGAGERKSPSFHERKPSAQEERLQQLMQRLDSLETTSSKNASPDAATATAVARPTTPSQRKPFSRESIQSTIENAKRWVNTDERSPVELRQKRGVAGSSLGRPQSFHVAERSSGGGGGGVGRSRAGSEEPPGGGRENENNLRGEYSSSLDKLNTSLSELQGEIMSLSLSNDNRKSTSKPPKGSAPRMTQSDDVLAQGIKDNFYLIPREGEVKEMGAEPVRMSQSMPENRTENRMQPDGSQPMSYSQPSASQRYGSPPKTYGSGSPQSYASPAQRFDSPTPGQQDFGGQYASPVGQYPAQQAGYVTSHGQNYGVVTSPHMYANMPTSSHPVHVAPPAAGHYVMYGQPVQAPNMPPAQWGAPMQPPLQQYGGVLQPNIPQHTAVAANSPAYAEYGHSPGFAPPNEPVYSPSMSHSAQNNANSPVYDNDAASYHQGTDSRVTTLDTDGSYLTSPTSRYRSASRERVDLHSPGRFPAVPQESSNVPAPAGPLQAGEGEGDSAGVPQPSAAKDGFFIAFDSNTPLKPRPKLGRERNNNPPRTEHAAKNSHPYTSPPTQRQPPASTSSLQSQPSPVMSASSGSQPEVDGAVYRASPRMVEAAPAEAFVISTNDEEDNAELTEIERRRQKFLQLQSRRKEEDSRKKKQLEENKMRLAEEQNQKQAQSEQRKAEEKLRREQIFADYLKRKAEREKAEQEARSGAAPVSRRNKLAKARGGAQRPKSQPALVHDAYSASSHSSQEDLRGRSPAPDRLHNYHGAPVHPDRAALFGAGHVAPVHPHMHDMHDGEPREYHSNVHSNVHSNALAYGGATHRRPPTPEAMTRSHGDHANNNLYSGPKLFKKPSVKSNKQVIIQAVSSCCLAGVVNNDVKNKVLEIINQSEGTQFVILFRDAGQQFRSLYTYNLDTEDIFKIYGVGPKQLMSKMLEKFYKYNCGAKKFSEVTTTKHMSATIDAVVMYNTYWTKKKVEKKPPAGYC